MRKLFILLFLVIFSSAIFAETISFDGEITGKNSKYFSVVSGKWYINKDGNNFVYVVDGRKNFKSYYFPLTIYNKIKNFSNGSISIQFKALGGKIDQAEGIAFNIKPNGDYLVIRANSLENNLILFKMENGRRSSLLWIPNVKTPSLVWNSLKIILKNRNIKAYVNGKLYINFTFNKKIKGKIGLWSKADSYVMFDNFSIK